MKNITLETIKAIESNVKINESQELRYKRYNIVENDFSGFVENQGATVKVNKTLPLHNFKGGRNLLLDSKRTISSLDTFTWAELGNITWNEASE